MSAPADDTLTAIGNVMQVLGTSFRTRDARPLAGIYAEDADWTNAFGTTLKGRQQIVDYLTGLFADPHFGAGQAGRPQVSIRAVTSDVVVVKTYTEIEGQQAVDGTTLSTRRNHSQGHPTTAGRPMVDSVRHLYGRTDGRDLSRSRAALGRVVN
jgi:uncharacterized protein (TIGR02246 family)